MEGWDDLINAYTSFIGFLIAPFIWVMFFFFWILYFMLNYFPLFFVNWFISYWLDLKTLKRDVKWHEDSPESLRNMIKGLQDQIQARSNWKYFPFCPTSGKCVVSLLKIRFIKKHLQTS